MKKKLLLLLLAGCCIFPITSCGNEKAQESTVVKEEKTYLTETEISSLFSDPEAYKGKYVKLDGQSFTSPEQDEVRTIIFLLTEKFSGNFPGKICLEEPLQLQ